MSPLRAFAESHRRELPLAIALFAVITHAHFFFSTSESHFRWDSGEYLAAAKNLAAGHGFRNAAGAIESRRTPGYPLFLIPFLILGSGTNAIVSTQHLLAILLAPCAYLLTLFLTNDALAASFAGLFVAIDSGQIYMANLVMTETLMSVLLFSTIAVLVRFARGHSLWLVTAAGLLVSFAVLVRPVAVYLWIPLTVWTFLAAPERRVKAAVLFAICGLALPLFWMWRNYERTGSAALSSIVGEDLYYWRAAGAVAMEKTGFTFVPLPFGGEEAFRKEFFRGTQREFVVAASAAHVRAFGPRAAAMTEAQLSEFDGRTARSILRDHISGAILISINGALHLLFDSTWEYANALYGGWTRVAVTIVLFVISVVTIGLALLGFARLHSIDRRSAWLLAVVLLYFVVALSGPEHEQWRYRVPLIPLCAVLVGCSVMRSEQTPAR